MSISFNTKKRLFFSALLIIFGTAVYLGYSLYHVTGERNILNARLDNTNNKFKLLQKKYIRQKSENSVLQRNKLSLKAQLRRADNALKKVEQEKKILDSEMEIIESKHLKKIAAFKKQIKKFKTRIVKLKENRDLYRVRLAETVLTVKERNQTIADLQADKAELGASLLETEFSLKRCKKHNADLCKISEDLVSVYHSKGLGKTLLQTEPFTQIKKVKLEQMVQEYLDKIDTHNLGLE